MLVEGIVYFESGVQVTFECLGRAFKSRIAGIDVEVHFPELEIVDYGGTVHTHIVSPKGTVWPPPISWITGQGSVGSMEDEKDPTTWGQPRISNTADINNPRGHAIVNQARLTFSLDADENSKGLFNTFIEKKLEWWKLVKRWLQSISFQYISNPRGSNLTSWTRNRQLWFLGNRGGELIDTGDFFFAWGRPIRSSFTPEGLTEIFGRAAAELEPKLPWEILNDAHQDHANGDLRRACVEAATALEISIEPWLEERLKDTDPQVREVLFQRPWTLGTKIENLIKLGWAAPANIRKVTQLRNDAIHQGQAPTLDGVNEILNIVLKALKDLDPEYGQLTESSLEAPNTFSRER